MNGNELPGWPVTIQSSVAQFTTTPAVADLNSDGHMEIIVSANGMYVFNATGQLQPGWPAFTDKLFYTSPAIADIDKDGFPEIVSSATNIDRSILQTYIIRHDATTLSGWPISTPAYTADSNVLADVDGDSYPDIVSTTYCDSYSYSCIMAYDRYGNVLAGFPKRMALAFQMFGASPPAVTSESTLGGAGRLVGSSVQYEGVSNYYVWNLPAHFENGFGNWPTLLHDSQHTGDYSYTNIIAGGPTYCIIRPQYMDTMVGIPSRFQLNCYDTYGYQTPCYNGTGLQKTTKWTTNLNSDVGTITGDNQAGTFITNHTSGSGMINVTGWDPLGQQSINYSCSAVITVNCACTPGWYCSNSAKAYKNCDCSDSNVTNCPYGCSNSACKARSGGGGGRMPIRELATVEGPDVFQNIALGTGIALIVGIVSYAFIRAETKQNRE